MSDYSFFKDQVVLVTGGSRGIGLEFAKLGEENGARVYATHYRTLQEEAADLQSDGKLSFIEVDLRNAKDAQSLVARVVKNEGRLDVVNANAAVSFLTPRGDISYERVRNESRALNVDAVDTVSHTYRGYLRDTGRRGALVIPSSVIVPMLGSSHDGNPNNDWIPVESFNPYASTKGAVEMLAGDYARTSNQSPDDGQLVVVVPRYGCVDTGLLRSEAEQLAPQFSKRTGEIWTAERVFNEVFVSSNKSGRILTPKETAEFTAQLLGDCLEDRLFRIVGQPGGPEPVDFNWK